jgi:hypothetical protein
VEAIPPAGVVDTTPDPASLKAEITALETKRQKAAEEAKEAEEKSIYWRKQKTESRADYFRGSDRVPERTAPPPVATQVSIGVEPKPADFADYDKYVEALADHRASRKIAEWESANEQKRADEAQQSEMADLHSKLDAGYGKFADFGEVAFDRTASHITPMVVEILKTCDTPADTLYYLAKNRVEGVAISRMTPIKAAREIAKIEAKLANGQVPSPAPPIQRKTTNAPPPINPLSGGTGGIEKDPSKMTQKEFEQWSLSKGGRRF